MKPGAFGGLLLVAATVVALRTGADGGVPRTAMQPLYPGAPRCPAAGHGSDESSRRAHACRPTWRCWFEAKAGAARQHDNASRSLPRTRGRKAAQRRETLTLLDPEAETAIPACAPRSSGNAAGTGRRYRSRWVSAHGTNRSASGSERRLTTTSGSGKRSPRCATSWRSRTVVSANSSSPDEPGRGLSPPACTARPAAVDRLMKAGIRCEVRRRRGSGRRRLQAKEKRRGCLGKGRAWRGRPFAPSPAGDYAAPYACRPRRPLSHGRCREPSAASRRFGRPPRSAPAAQEVDDRNGTGGVHQRDGDRPPRLVAANLPSRALREVDQGRNLQSCLHRAGEHQRLAEPWIQVAPAPLGHGGMVRRSDALGMRGSIGGLGARKSSRKMQAASLLLRGRSSSAFEPAALSRQPRRHQRRAPRWPRRRHVSRLFLRACVRAREAVARCRRWESKRERPADRELVAAYHEAQLAELLGHVAEAVDRFRAGEVDAFAVDDLIHQYKQAARELWKFCWLAGAGSGVELTVRVLRRHVRPRRARRLVAARRATRARPRTGVGRSRAGVRQPRGRRAGP